jgi:hypothetical protein
MPICNKPIDTNFKKIEQLQVIFYDSHLLSVILFGYWEYIAGKYAFNQWWTYQLNKNSKF